MHKLFKRGFAQWSRERVVPIAVAILTTIYGLTLGGRISDAALTNYVALHLTTALSPYPVGFHHLIEASNRQCLALTLSKVGEAALRPIRYPRLPCLLLRTSLVLMDWEKATKYEPLCAYDVIREAPAWESDFDVLRGLVALQEGYGDKALAAFRQALIRGDGINGASLASLVAQLTSTQASSKWCAEHLANTPVAPEYLLGHIVNGQWVYESQPVGSTWELVGFSYDRVTLESNPVFGALLYWKPSRPEAKPPAGWVLVGDYWVECTRLYNFMPNAGFEWTQLSSAMEIPFLFQTPEQLRIELSAREGRSTHVAKLLDDPTATPRGLSYGPYPVESDCYYLQAGWLSSQQGWPIFGRVWLETVENKSGRELLLAAEQRWMLNNIYGGTFDWFHFASVVSAPIEARGVMVQVIDWRAPGWLAADDLL